MATKKWTKVDERILSEFNALEEDGCVSASNWVNGRRRQISKKALPAAAIKFYCLRDSNGTPFDLTVEEVGKFAYYECADEIRECETRALNYFAKYPKRKKVIVMNYKVLNELRGE